MLQIVRDVASYIGDRRREMRRPIEEPTSVQFDGVRHSAVLVNLSEGGAMLECAATAVVGGRAILFWHGDYGVGRVAWASDGRFGLPFDVHKAALSNRGEWRRGVTGTC